MSSRFLLIAARLAAETDRADAAERQANDLLAQIRLLHKDKLQLRAELAKSHQELQLWKVQLDHAQKEILRAQTVVDQIDRARADAEDQAHRYRRQIRLLVEERSIQAAIDQGRHIGFQEGLELGRRRQLDYRTTTPRPPSRRDSARTPAPLPVPPVPVLATQPASVPITQPTPAPVARPAPEETRQPVSIHNAPESIHDTYEVPPDNFIPVIHQGESGIMLPPPHEWINRPRSESQSTHHPNPPPPNDPRPTLLSPILETKTPNHHSRSSSRISQFDILGPPTTGTQMTQPERIADEWRAQNPDVVTPTPSSISTQIRTVPQSDVVAIPRPKSTTNHLGAKFIPPQRPTTTEPTSLRSNTPKSGSKSSRKQLRQPIPVSNIFYDPPTSTTPKPTTADQDWLKSQFSLPKRQHEKGSPTNTERTAVNPALLPTHESEHNSTKDTSPPKKVSIKRAPSVAPTTLSAATSTTNMVMAYNVIPGPPMFALPSLSPIPTLSNLTSIPETKSAMMGTSAGTVSDGDEGDGDSGFGYEQRRQQQQQQQQQQQYQRPPSRMTKPLSSVPSLSMSVKENNSTTSVLGSRTNHLSDYYQNYPIHQHQQQFYQPGPTDIVVMNSRVESSPTRKTMNANADVNAYGGNVGASPAPLDRRLSIFDDM